MDKHLTCGLSESIPYTGQTKLDLQSYQNFLDSTFVIPHDFGIGGIPVVNDQVHVDQESMLHNINWNSGIRLTKGNFWRDYINT